MKVIVGSKNPSKSEAVRLALEKLGYCDVEIVGMEVASGVGSKPINYEIQLGAETRNENLRRQCLSSGIDYDFLVSIEGGIEQDDNKYYLVTYASVFTKDTGSSMGKSVSIPITERMYYFYKKGHSINKVIESILGTIDNKKGSGISGYLSDDIFRRSKVDSEAVISAFLPLLNKEKFEKIDSEILVLINKKEQ